MKINKLLTPFNFTDCNNASRIKYAVVHYVGALGDAKENCQYYASQYVGASAHLYVGFDGQVWQSVEDEDIAWSVGANSYIHPEARNSNTLNIELCVRKKSTSSMNATDKDWFFEPATVKAAIELVKSKMKQYDIPPENVIRHYDVTGKICPNPYVYNNTAYIWEDFKKQIAGSTPDQSSLTKITGAAKATDDQMERYIRSVNKKIPQSVIDMLPLYLSEGKAENIRGDVAFAQSCLETGNFTFKDSAVTLDQNNFCGMGVTENGMKGNSFPNAKTGIRAQIQHLKGYANKAALKKESVDPRFEYVARGCAPYVEWLGIQENPNKKGWAAGAGYGEKILKILDKILAGKNEESKPPVPDAEEPVTGYQVKVTVDNLNIRSGAGTGYSIVGSITDKGTYTIVQEKNGWGKLKSGAGWIFLSYTRKKTDANPETPKEYQVKVKADILNIRSGAGTGYGIVGTITDKGTYTIVQEKSEWGKLKSGAGWIALSYTAKA